jgi:hypothetical protein
MNDINSQWSKTLMPKSDECRETEENFRIGLSNEKSLHASMKQWYALPGDQFEVKVAGYFIDIVRCQGKAKPPLLIEIQTGNFTALRRKLIKLLPEYPVRLVYPIAREKWIIRISSDGEIRSRRKSPKTGTIYDLFKELIRIPDLINDPHFSIEVILTQEEHIWCEDGWGSWRRKGVSIKDRKLLAVVEQIRLLSKEDFLQLLPHKLKYPFSNKELAACSNSNLHQAQKMTYCLRKMGTLKQAGKHGNQLLYDLNEL